MKEAYIFLDIDGVMRPFVKYHPINYRQNLGSMLSRKFCDNRYEDIDEGTLCSVYQDFHPEAIAVLQNVLQQTKALIILSTSWIVLWMKHRALVLEKRISRHILTDIRKLRIT